MSNVAKAHVLLHGAAGLEQVALQGLRLLGLDVLWGVLEAGQGCGERLLPPVDLVRVAGLVDSVRAIAELGIGVDGVVVLGVGIRLPAAQAEEGEPKEHEQQTRYRLCELL